MAAEDSMTSTLYLTVAHVRLLSGTIQLRPIQAVFICYAQSYAVLAYIAFDLESATQWFHVRVSPQTIQKRTQGALSLTLLDTTHMYGGTIGLLLAFFPLPSCPLRVCTAPWLDCPASKLHAQRDKTLDPTIQPIIWSSLAR
jgi:hypothetical protein